METTRWNKRQGWISLWFSPLLAFEELTVLPGSPWGGYSWGPSRIPVWGQRHMIKEEKSRNWGQGCIFNAGIQSTEVQYQSSIFQYLQRRGWRQWDRILPEGLQTGNRETGRGCICLPFKWVSLRVLPAPKIEFKWCSRHQSVLLMDCSRRNFP